MIKFYRTDFGHLNCALRKPSAVKAMQQKFHRDHAQTWMFRRIMFLTLLDQRVNNLSIFYATADHKPWLSV